MDRGSIYVAIFSLRDMADLCPKGIDLDMKPSAPSSPPTLPPYPGLQTMYRGVSSWLQEHKGTQVWPLWV